MVLRLRGGGCFPCGVAPFTDLSDPTAVQKQSFQTTGIKPWRIAKPGLCVEGYCEEIGCKAHGQLVIDNKGYTHFDLMQSGSQCPCCCRSIEPVTCAFNNCEWRYTGVKLQDPNNPSSGQLVESDTWTDVGHEYLRFSSAYSRQVAWQRLLVVAREPHRSTAAAAGSNCKAAGGWCTVPARARQLRTAAGKGESGCDNRSRGSAKGVPQTPWPSLRENKVAGGTTAARPVRPAAVPATSTRKQQVTTSAKARPSNGTAAEKVAVPALDVHSKVMHCGQPHSDYQHHHDQQMRQHSKGQGDKEVECSICFADEWLSKSDPEVVTTACGHSFHKSCLAPWLDQKANCPNCRSHLAKLRAVLMV